MAKKGSQLKRFKESLSALTQGKNAGRRKRPLSDKDPERKEKLKHIEQQFNAFDTKFTRSKHEVFGRKVKGKSGKPAVSRELGEERRKAALLKQRQQRNKVGGVIDRRFGEDDPNMDPEERMLERFAMEKKKRSRNMSLYNLEDNAQLTHFGQSLAEIDDYEEDMIGVSDDDGDLKEEVVRQDHFGGNFDAEDSEDEADKGENPERVKTKSEVMAEVMAKSKMYKHERQQQHEEDLDEIEDLDAELGEIQGLLNQITPILRTQPTKTKEMLSYDAALREMVYDKRSKPTERTKTEEEIAQEEKERLETLEKERLRRMRGEEVDVVEDSSSKRHAVRREGDDLDDDFVPDEGEEDLYGFGKGALADISDQEDDVSEEGGEGEQEEGEDGADDDKEDEDSEDEFDLAEYFTDEEVNRVANQNGAKFDSESDDEMVPATKRLRLAESSSTTKELAYTYPCPSTLEELLNITQDIPTESIPIVIQRIETLYSLKLLAENREKLETFTPLILQLLLYLGADNSVSFTTSLAIIARLHVLATQFPSALTQQIFAAIADGRKRLAKSISDNNREFPARQDLVLFYTIGQIYETSDLIHPVVNATTLWMSQLLGQMRVRGIKDIARGLFICSVYLQYQTLAKRMCPEVVQFLNYSLLQLLSPDNEALPETRADIGAAKLLPQLAKVNASKIPAKLPFTSLYGNVNEAHLYYQVINMALDLVDASSELWKASVALPELFHQTTEILTSISKTDLPAPLKAHLNDIRSSLSRRIKLSLGSRASLTLQVHRPIPIPSYLPKYSMSYSLDSKNDPDHERSGLGKLKAQHRREKKSVIRELRKEARTEAVVKSEEGRRRDKAYQEKMRIATGIMKGGNAGIGKWERDQKRKRR